MTIQNQIKTAVKTVCAKYLRINTANQYGFGFTMGSVIPPADHMSLGLFSLPRLLNPEPMPGTPEPETASRGFGDAEPIGPIGSVPGSLARRCISRSATSAIVDANPTVICADTMCLPNLWHTARPGLFDRDYPSHEQPSTVRSMSNAQPTMQQYRGTVQQDRRYHATATNR